MTDLTMDFHTNDLLITNGDLSLISGQDAIAQDLQQRLQVWLGEWFLDTAFGVPYRQQILIKNPNMDIVQADLIATITATPGVTQVLDFEFTYSTVGRTLNVSTVVQTSNGQTIQVQANINSQVSVGTIEGTVY